MFYRKFVQPIEYQPALEAFRQYSVAVPGILFESVDIAPVYGRKSLFIIDPIVEVIGYNDKLTIQALHETGEIIKQQIPSSKSQTNSKFQLRDVFNHIKTDDPYFGLFGMFSYDYVRQFEALPQLQAELDMPDFIYTFPI